ncbi:hypothetical protein L9F63_007495 [Diploptera punctata]|uniref:Uncharacterized protein n=1 Tax=Diploptera punctata TaxID=6984 RepID=A0AAD7Z7Z6_DIPPU|nr:hypothetical protein L9F63_007495 [Diploptera punctata]
MGRTCVADGARKILKVKPEGRRKFGRQKLRWLDKVEEDLRQLKVKRWRQKASNREEWGVMKKAKVLRGLYSQRKKKKDL